VYEPRRENLTEEIAGFWSMDGLGISTTYLRILHSNHVRMSQVCEIFHIPGVAAVVAEHEETIKEKRGRGRKNELPIKRMRQIHLLTHPQKRGQGHMGRLVVYAVTLLLKECHRLELPASGNMKAAAINILCRTVQKCLTIPGCVVSNIVYNKRAEKYTYSGFGPCIEMSHEKQSLEDLEDSLHPPRSPPIAPRPSHVHPSPSLSRPKSPSTSSDRQEACKRAASVNEQVGCLAVTAESCSSPVSTPLKSSTDKGKVYPN